MLTHISRITPARAHSFFMTPRMLSATKLTDQETSDAIEKLNASAAAPVGAGFGWEKESTGRNAIQKSYRFKDFKQAWDWMSKVAVLAEDMNHHPEWFNVYNMVDVKLTTHDSKGVSALDIEMATKMDEYADEIMPTRKMTEVKKLP